MTATMPVPAMRKTALRVLEADDLGRGLCGIAVPNDGAVVIYRGGVVETEGTLLRKVGGMGRRRSASTLTMPNSDSTRFKVPFTRLTRRLLEEVTRKFWPTGPSKLPWTWHWRRLQRFKTEDKPPVVRTMYRSGLQPGLERQE